MSAVAFFASLLAGLALIPLIRQVSIRYGLVAKPREDRWHDKPTATLGGVGILAVFIIGLAIAFISQGIRLSNWDFEHWGLLLAAGLMFCMGLYDDLRPLSPTAKFIGQVMIAALVVFMGYTTEFFSPRVDNVLLAQSLNTLLTIIWLVGITNAFNLLDNMDGLAAGIAAITAAILGYFFWRDSNSGMLLIVLALAGSILGFLRYNFPPASIFMGDSGSQFLGFTLALLAIARQPEASGVLAVVAVPTLIFLLPIVDTTLVTLTRILRGESPAKGGRDHTSHRLIAFGLTERQAVLFLYGIALLAGVASILIEAIGYWLSLVLLPLMVILLALLAAYLSGIKLTTAYDATPSHKKAATQVMLEFAYKRRFLEVALDVLLVSLIYFLSVWLHKGAILSPVEIEQFLHTLPLILSVTLLCFYFLGVYRSVWRYLGTRDLVRYALASMVAAGVNAVGVYFLYPESFSPVLFVLYAILLFLGVAASRSSFRLLDSISQRNQEKVAEERVVIFGADGAGEIAMRWILMHPELNYKLVGFLDDDPLLAGRQIAGLGVLGGIRQLASILEKHHIDGLILARVFPVTEALIFGGNPDVNGIDAPRVDPWKENLLSICKAHDCWVSSLQLIFERLEM
jgi:UDP-GlcNAc:undecaprenyl-phosphate GlcNAc-1-phosphate transferase